MGAILFIWAGLALFALQRVPYKTHQVQLGILVVIAVLLAFVYSNAKSNRAKARIGAKSERRVAKVVAELNPVALLNSTLLGAGGDADHIVLGPWAVVIETKTGHGHARYDGQHMRVGAKTIPGNPVTQVQRQARALHSEASTYVDAIVCIVDMDNAPFAVGSTTVCALRDLPGVIAGLERRLDETAALRLYDHLNALHRTAAPTKLGISTSR